MLGFCPLLLEKPLGPKAFGLAASPRKQFEVDWQRVHRIKMKMAVSIWLFLKKPTKIHPLLILIRSSCPFWGCGWGLLRHSSGLVKNAHWTGSLLIQEHFGSKSEILSNKSVFSISTHRLWTHFACLLQRHVWIWIHQALLLRKQRSDEKKICWLTLLIAPCYSYCIWLITPAFCSLKHWETSKRLILPRL